MAQIIVFSPWTRVRFALKAVMVRLLAHVADVDKLLPFTEVVELLLASARSVELTFAVVKLSRARQCRSQQTPD